MFIWWFFNFQNTKKRTKFNYILRWDITFNYVFYLFILLLVEVDDVSLFGGDYASIIYNLLFLSLTFIYT